jgi:hypothetical protein
VNEDFPKSLYEAEWVRRDQLQGAVGTPLGLLTLLGSAILFLYKEAPSFTGATKWFFAIALGFALLAFGCAVYSLVRSYHGYMYQRIPHASKLMAYRRGLQAHYASIGELSKADPEFVAYLNDRYIEATDKNAVNNIRRGEFLHTANAALIWTLLATAVAAVPASRRMRSDEPKLQRVEITNLPSTAMPNEPTNSQPADTAPAAPATPKPDTEPIVVPKPVPPMNIDLRTEVLIPKKK